jgi:methylmalonyl-CoA/ethylmalonyl-CoA epimerase
MKGKASMMAVVFALFVIAGCMTVSVPSATGQADGPGFEISHHHVAISVANVEESIAWYKKMFGFEEVLRMNQGENNAMVVAHIRRGNCYIELFQVAGSKPLPEYRRDPTADLGVQGFKHMAFEVSDVSDATKKLKAKGAEIALGPVDTAGVAFVFIRDNSGNTFELIQYKKQ